MVIDDTAATVYGANWQRKSSADAVGGTFLQNRKRDDRAVYWFVDQAGFQGGTHDIWVRWLQPATEGSNTVYAVKASTEPAQRISIDHRAHRPGDWVLLGNFDFAAAGASPAQYVGLTGFDNRNGSEGTFLEADAVKLRPTSVRESTSRIRFIHGDHLGTPQFVTDVEGRVVWSASYQPFGKADVDQDPDGDGKTYALPLRFPGQYHDGESGLHYNYFRTYDPALGRYLESDPIGMDGGLNTFLYAGANPTKHFDPLGLAVRGEWIESPRFNLQEAGIEDWQLINPSLSNWGYLQFIRLQGHAKGYVNIDVRCTERCDEWEIHDRVNVSAQGAIDVGPNLYALGMGLVTRNPIAGVGANMALGGAALLQAELHFLNLARQKAGPLIAALLANGPTLICLGSNYDDL
jgi:RHS repeat-associated protein